MEETDYNLTMNNAILSDIHVTLKKMTEAVDSIKEALVMIAQGSFEDPVADTSGLPIAEAAAEKLTLSNYRNLDQLVTEVEPEAETPEPTRRLTGFTGSVFESIEGDKESLESKPESKPEGEADWYGKLHKT